MELFLGGVNMNEGIGQRPGGFCLLSAMIRDGQQSMCG